MELEPNVVTLVEPAEPVLTFSADRDTDLLQADFSFYGFTVDKTTTPTSLVATATKTPDNWIGVVVHFPPQAIAEADYDWPQTSSPLSFDPTPVLSQVSGPSRLAFTFATGDKIPLPTMTVADLIDWSGWELHVPSAAVTGTGVSSPTAPSAIETAIECPLALILAPVVDGGTAVLRSSPVPSPVRNSFSTRFENPTEPFTSSANVTECWATSLSATRTQGTATSAIVPSVAAVWANDYPKSSADATPQLNIYYFLYSPLQ
jgi:hypothetical protein